MGAAAVNVLHGWRLAAVPEDEREPLRRQLVAEQERTACGVDRAVELGVVDEVIEPGRTGHRIAAALADARPVAARTTTSGCGADRSVVLT
jgi:acetyl-CoA/propionyl-CoA carboxylase carboxyl transferase subunit